MSRNEVEIQGAELIVTPRGIDKLWSLTNEVRVPLSLVRGATYDPGVVTEPKGEGLIRSVKRCRPPTTKTVSVTSGT
ncbi:Uncharacterised protein [Chlamydia trachomatis]|nr:Uncharacterised protein [Chlamydia trachomatis]CRH90698.1 Uncharacterised protein [Chlamydia trachomatis]